MKFYFILFCLLWPLSLTAVTLPFTNLSAQEEINYKKHPNSFLQAFCKQLSADTRVSKPIEALIESPSDEKFEQLLQSSHLTQADQIIAKNYLEHHAKPELVKKYQPLFESLNSQTTSCLSAQIHILGYYLTQEAFIDIVSKFKKQIIKLNINLRFLYVNEINLPQTLQLNKEWSEITLQNQATSFVHGSCDQPQINPDIYNFLDKDTSFDFVYGENCYFQKDLETFSTDANKIEQPSIWKNKYLWIGVGLIAGGFLLSKSNNELVIEY